jgi:lipoprotein-anchoring transpeptidase ErfK/SrfK
MLWVPQLLVAFAAFVPSTQEAGRTSLTCDDVFAVQVLLDQHGFSPGEIDGLPGPNSSRALAAFQTAKGLPVTGTPDCVTLDALGGANAQVTSEYTITDADTQAAFTPGIPEDLVAQKNLPALGYRTLIEGLGERFHAAPALLERLNHGSTFAAGTTIVVPAVQPFDPSKKPAHDETAADVRIEVTREDSAMRVLTADGTLLFHAPVTIGSERDPLPIGEWRVKGVSWMPTFHYNPDLFWDADPTQAKATIQPGPNNPVGVVWIDIDVEHRGLHGTPEPSKVGHTASHGCVRLTNWDAARVAAMVRTGTPVIFR